LRGQVNVTIASPRMTHVRCAVAVLVGERAGLGLRQAHDPAMVLVAGAVDRAIRAMAMAAAFVARLRCERVAVTRDGC
jgi:hypothetical protein